jgi:hypothetical protein
MNNHLYLVKDKFLVLSMVGKAKEHKIETSLLEYDEIKNYYEDEDDKYKTIYLNETMDNVKVNLPKHLNLIYMYSRSTHNIKNDVFEPFVSTFNNVAMITRCDKSNGASLEAHDNNVIVSWCDPSNDINEITYKAVEELCIQNHIEWKNQTYTEVITNLKNNFFDELRGRIKFTKEQRNKFNKEFKFKCNMRKCCTKEKPFEIDHITPLSGGGTNEKSSLQVLCKACHLIKTANEHETGQYIKISDTDSTFNSLVQEIMNSPLSQTHACVEQAHFKESQEDHTIFTIDINKCRKNILYYGKFDYCVFTVLDKVEEFKGATIRPGFYYVESDNYMPLRANGWYHHNMVCYCIENDIIKLDNI